jgi:tetratricopeptide (TPR) repeat protein
MKWNSRVVILVALVFTPFFCCLGETLFSKSYSEGKRLFDSGRYAEAYEVLYELFEQAPDNADVNFYLGRCAFENQDFEGALMAYERILIRYPDAQRVKLELGRCYYQMRSYDMAASFFEEVARQNPAPMVRAKIEHFLQRIEAQRKQNQLHRLYGNFNLGLGFDTNAHVSPENDIIQTIRGPVDLSGAAAARTRTFFQNASLSLTHRYRFNRPRWFWENTAYLYNAWYPEEGDLDTQYLGLSFGPVLETQTQSLRLQVNGYRLYQDDLAYLDAVGLALPVARVFGEHFLSTAVARYDRKHYREGSERHADNFSLEWRPVWAWPRDRITGRVRLENEDATLDTDSYKRLTAGLTLEHSLPKGVLLSLGYRFQQTHYEERNATFFADKRRDMVHEMRAALLKKWSSRLSSELSYTRTESCSTVDLYDYERDVILLQTSFSF